MAEQKENSMNGIQERDVKVINEVKENAKREKKRKILRISACVIGGVLLVLILAFIFRDLLISCGVRHVGTLLTGTKVEIASFDSSLNGSVDLKKFRVANPKGYQKPYAVEVDRVRVKIDMKTLTSDEPIIEYVEVTGVRIDMEVKGADKSNLTDIQKNVERFVVKKAEKKTEKKKEKSQEPAPLIKKIELSSMMVSFSSSTLKSSLPVPLAPIYLENVGGKGKPIGEALLGILDTIMRSINSVAGSVMKGVEFVGNTGKAIGDGVADGAKSIGNAGKAIGDGVADGARSLGRGVKSIGDGVSGLFKKK